MKLSLTILIPTYNEEKNIARAIESVAPFVNQVLVVDSWSGDKTLQKAKSVSDNVDVIFVEFTTFSNKMNIALASEYIRNNWVMRLDADEVVVEPESFFHALSAAIDDHRIDRVGFYINRRYYFLNEWIMHGGLYPRMVLRVFKKGKAQFENKSVDEKMVLDGTASFLDIEIADACQKGIMHWIWKHIQYAKREAADTRQIYKRTQRYDLEFDNENNENKKKYYRMPLFLRPLIYFAYRFIVQKGISDGPQGWLYHFLHAFVYRELVDYYIVKLRIEEFLKKKITS